MYFDRFKIGAINDNKQLYMSWLIVASAIFFVYAPVVHQVYFSQGEELGGSTSTILLLIALFLFIKRVVKQEMKPSYATKVSGFLLVVLSMTLFFFGNILVLPMLTIGSIIPLLSAIVLIFWGMASQRKVFLPLLLLLFVIPLPYVMTDFIVQPLKLLISHISEYLLYSFGFPVARSGVVLSIGNYQLLVADACSGINSLFSLEAIALLYLNVVKRESSVRNWVIGLVIIPISITANVTRIIILSLLTYYFGNDVGQGFMHEASGLLLFGIALSLVLSIDNIIDKFTNKKTSHQETQKGTIEP